MKKTFKQVMLSSGEKSDFGSDDSINELEGAIDFLKGVRDNIVAKNRQFRKERYTISRAIDSLKHVKRNAERINSKLLIKESVWIHPREESLLNYDMRKSLIDMGPEFVEKADNLYKRDPAMGASIGGMPDEFIGPERPTKIFKIDIVQISREHIENMLIRDKKNKNFIFTQKTFELAFIEAYRYLQKEIKSIIKKVFKDVYPDSYDRIYNSYFGNKKIKSSDWKKHSETKQIVEKEMEEKINKEVLKNSKVKINL